MGLGHQPAVIMRLSGSVKKHEPSLNPPILRLQPSAYEQVDWFPECTTEIPDAQEMKEWMTVGKV